MPMMQTLENEIERSTRRRMTTPFATVATTPLALRRRRREASSSSWRWLGGLALSLGGGLMTFAVSQLLSRRVRRRASLRKVALVALGGLALDRWLIRRSVSSALSLNQSRVPIRRRATGSMLAIPSGIGGSPTTATTSSTIAVSTVRCAVDPDAEEAAAIQRPPDDS